jgi:uncharacterized SAM-binding protein YcdF (DUF218 family)
VARAGTKGTRRRGMIVLLAFVLLVLALLAFHRTILTALGEHLLAQDKLEKSDAALVISGEDGDGTRTRTAVALYKQGWVKKVVLSGARGTFGHYESDYSGPLALSLGVPPKDLIVITSRARSTQEEANVVVPEMERVGIRSIILVTSNFHSSRARRYFRRVCKDRMRVLVNPADNEFFHPDSWWQTREGMKYFLWESAKFWTSYFE